VGVSRLAELILAIRFLLRTHRPALRVYALKASILAAPQVVCRALSMAQLSCSRLAARRYFCLMLRLHPPEGNGVIAAFDPSDPMTTFGSAQVKRQPLSFP